MTVSAEVTVIGAGVIGASVAYHLAARGCKDVILIDRSAQPGGGSTSRATGGFRAQFTSEINVRLSLMSREKLLRFSDEVGCDPGYQPNGYLFLAKDDREMELLRGARATQRAAGLSEVVELSRAEVVSLNPALDAASIAGGSFCPIDGFLLPMEILRGYLTAAERLGVRIEFGARCEKFEAAPSGEITTTVTSKKRISSRVVVNAAGAWAAEIGLLAGIEIPVRPVRHQVGVTQPTNVLPANMPMTIFVEDGFHFRVRDGRVLLLWPAGDSGTTVDTSVDSQWLERVESLAQSRVPSLRGTKIDRERCWAGLYEMSPDRHVLLGTMPRLPNFFLANGSSGHGVMHAPALGQLAAELILDGSARTLDIHPLRPSRFAEHQPNASSELL